MLRVKLGEIAVEGFRGALEPVRLQLGKDHRSLVLFGNNADGKSTFTDALEWFLTDEVEHLRKEGCGREDFFNRALALDEDASVTLSFSIPPLNCTKTLRRRGGCAFSNTTDNFKGFALAMSRERLILRHHTMRAFVDKSKKDKLEEVEDIIGFGVVKSVRNELVRASNALASDPELSQLKGKLAERERDLSSLLSGQPITEAMVVEFAERLRQAIKWPQPIMDLQSLSRAATDIDQQVKSTDKGKRLGRLAEVEKLVLAIGAMRQTIETVREQVAKHNEIVSQRKTVEASALSKLYEAAVDVLSKRLIEPGKCPVCGSKVDTDALVMRLRSDVEAIKKVLAARNSLLKGLEPLKVKLTQLSGVLEELGSNMTADVFADAVHWPVLTQWRSTVDSWNQSLNTISAGLDSVVLVEPSERDWVAFDAVIQRLSKELQAQRATMVETEEERRFYENVSRLKNASEWYLRYVELRRMVDRYEAQVASLQRICAEFERFESNALKDVLDAISQNVNEYFTKYLHQDERVEQVQLIFTGERGIEFRIRFYGQDLYPPRRVLSESHLNSLGICLFLAAARYFNVVSGFVVLDDVVSSFDANHRRTLARLLRDKFSDMQVLLLTHDDLWFEQLKRDLPQGQWAFKEAGRWTFERGIQLIDTPLSLRQEIEWLLDTNRIPLAANRCRTLIEAILKERCEKLGVQLEFRIGRSSDQREATELIDGLVHYLKANQSLRSPEQKALFDDVKSGQLLTNIGSHHRHLEATTLVRGDIELTLRDLDEFEALFICAKCGKGACKDYTPRSAKLKQCECGTLRI